MSRNVMKSAAALTLAFSLAISSTASGNEPAPFLTFAEKTGSDGLRIECEVKKGARAPDASWVDRCNELGRKAIDHAVENGTIAPVKGPAFGEAAAFVAGAGLRGPARIARTFPRIAAPL